ncbi:MAG: DUF2796 domain-containing protein [Halofilum sp. (in: g-proteobacteria)]|nr:DUF2796 domain-containing protein [Halofilum sp. (in: g-proteobacteria)]
MNHRYCLPVLAAALVAHGAANAERRDHGAHVHGVMEMDVAALGEELEIALRSPAMNIVGFEHAPRTDEQHARLDNAVAGLRDGAALFDFANAGCALREVEVHHEHEADGHGHDEHADHEHEEHEHEDDHAGQEDEHEHEAGHEDATHSEIRAHYDFACEGAVTRLTTTLFERFPRTESIRVQFLTDDAQGAQTLTADSPVLRARSRVPCGRTHVSHAARSRIADKTGNATKRVRSG